MSIVLLASLAPVAGANSLSDPFSSDRTPGFAVRFQGELNPYPLMAVFVMPGEELELEVEAAVFSHDYLVEAERGDVTRRELGRWVWRAPEEPGMVRVTIQNFSTARTMCLKAFVLRPYDGSAEFRGFPIGRYEPEPLDGDPAYERPAGLIEVTPETESTWITPHFRLGDFLCKQEGGYPRYLALKTRLLIKLEMLQEEVARQHGPEARLIIMSAYRTPRYNAAIGNRTTYSRHLYGDAADVYIDRDGDDRMDDLDGDGRVSTADAGRLYMLVEDMLPQPWYTPFVGGLGLYGPRPHRGPFIHVDTRGSHARWGDGRGRPWIRAHCPDCFQPPVSPAPVHVD